MRVLVRLYDYNLLILTKQVLEEHKIPYIVRNEQIQSIIFGQSFSAGINPVAGYYEVLVNEEDYDVASEILKEFFSNLFDI